MQAGVYSANPISPTGRRGSSASAASFSSLPLSQAPTAQVEERTLEQDVAKLHQDLDTVKEKVTLMADLIKSKEGDQGNPLERRLNCPDI